ncbi:MAG: prepilin-type N-terminal cleavage/methylation domain-containing protein [Burkholderiaceae bacterium]
MARQTPIAGVSLIEVMVVLVVLGVLLSMAAPAFNDFINRRRVQAIAAEISSDLAYARAESGLRANDVIVMFKTNGTMSCYTIGYLGTGGSECNCTRGAGAACPGSWVELKTVQFPGSLGVNFTSTGTWLSPRAPNRIQFKAPQMLPAIGDFSVAVDGRHQAQLRVEVNSAGRISTCSPATSSMSGFRACEQ